MITITQRGVRQVTVREPDCIDLKPATLAEIVVDDRADGDLAHSVAGFLTKRAIGLHIVVLTEKY